jgi:hypothetical protein
MGLCLLWALRVSRVIGFRSGFPAPCSLLYALGRYGKGKIGKQLWSAVYTLRGEAVQDRDSSSLSPGEPLYPHRENREGTVVGGLYIERRGCSNHFSEKIEKAGDEAL